MKIFSILLIALLQTCPAAAAEPVRLPDPASFFHTIERGDLVQARLWLDAGLRPDFEGHLVGSGLMIAAWEGNVPMMELFVARGADVNKTNVRGEQALLYASWKGHLAAVRWLVDHGAEFDRDGKEWSALHYAAFAGHEAVVGYLLERGADINALSVNGSTPLMMAAREGKEQIAVRLLASGARTDIDNDAGENALKWAMRNNNLIIARTIAGAEKFARAAAQPPGSWGQSKRSEPVPDSVDALLAQARKFEEAGQRDAALKVYQAAMSKLRKTELATKSAPPPRAVTGLMITARRGDPETQSAGLRYATPATPTTPDTPAIQAAGAQTATTGAAVNSVTGSAEGSRATVTNAPPAPVSVVAPAAKPPPPVAAVTAPPTPPASSAPAPVSVEDWLRRGRELEAAGQRAEALQAYRQASAALRTVR
jgi:tetratricopeptide (TPR) repeat protein